MGSSDFARMREEMVRRQLAARDIADPKVLAALGSVPREEFVPEPRHADAYGDFPLPIGHGQTISQPYVVAYMTQAALLKGGERCLEIGAGSGYQAAVLSSLCKEVASIEIVRPLADSADERLARLGYGNVTVRCGDGYQGWADRAPFDAILVAAAGDHVPRPLVRQLAEGGRLVMPVGGRFFQALWRYTKTGGAVAKEKLLAVQFVPLTGPLEENPPDAAPAS